MDAVQRENYEQCARCLTSSVIWMTQTVNRYYSILHLLVLVGILVAFSIIGGYVFQQIEATHEKTISEGILNKRHTVIESVLKQDKEQEKGSELTILQYEGNFIKAIQSGAVMVNGETQTLWTFGGSVYFCMTTYTLLGYGNLAPKSNLGRVIAIVYSGFCIPIASLIIGDIGEIIQQLLYFTWQRLSRIRVGSTKNQSGNNVYCFHLNEANILRILVLRCFYLLAVARIFVSKVLSKLSFHVFDTDSQTLCTHQKPSYITNPSDDFKVLESSTHVIPRWEGRNFGRELLRKRCACLPNNSFSHNWKRSLKHNDEYEDKSSIVPVYKDDIGDRIEAFNLFPSETKVHESECAYTNDAIEPYDASMTNSVSCFHCEIIDRFFISQNFRSRKDVLKRGASISAFKRRIYGFALPFKWLFFIQKLRDRSRANKILARRKRKSDYNNSADIWEDPEMMEYALFGLEEKKTPVDIAPIPQSSVPILMTTIMGFVYIGAGSIALSMMSDQLSFFDCFWFMFISTLTVGYGDVVPADQELMIFFLLYIFICLSLMSNVINEISQFFNANVGKIRDIGHDAVGIIKARKEIVIKKEKSNKARKHWKIVRDRVKKGRIPKRLIRESKKYKAMLMAEEREHVRWAFQIYFEYLCRKKLMEPPVPEEGKPEEPAESIDVVPEPVEPSPAESGRSSIEDEGDEDEETRWTKTDYTKVYGAGEDITDKNMMAGDKEAETIYTITEHELEVKKLTWWQKVKRFTKKQYGKSKAFTKKVYMKIKNSKLFKRKKKEPVDEEDGEPEKKKPFYFT